MRGRTHSSRVSSQKVSETGRYPSHRGHCVGHSTAPASQAVTHPSRVPGLVGARVLTAPPAVSSRTPPATTRHPPDLGEALRVSGGLHSSAFGLESWRSHLEARPPALDLTLLSPPTSSLPAHPWAHRSAALAHLTIATHRCHLPWPSPSSGGLRVPGVKAPGL